MLVKVFQGNPTEVGTAVKNWLKTPEAKEIKIEAVGQSQQNNYMYMTVFYSTPKTGLSDL